MMDYFNAIFSVLITLACAYVIFSHRIHEGPIIRVGLSLLGMAHAVSVLMFVDGVVNEPHQTTLIHTVIFVGVWLIAFGYWWRTRNGQFRRMSDWVESEMPR